MLSARTVTKEVISDDQVAPKRPRDVYAVLTLPVFYFECYHTRSRHPSVPNF